MRNATTSLLLECMVEAPSPVPFLEIRRRSQEEDLVLSTILGSSRMLTLQYTLENLMLNDSAVYVCVANNSIGLEEQNFTLVVQGGQTLNETVSWVVLDGHEFCVVGLPSRAMLPQLMCSEIGNY